jgi:coiled-coil domain-containing protein 130
MQGFNMGRYYPPDATNPPQFNASSHPLGSRARKLNQGILTVRFEVPFAIWCETCKPPVLIGQGVRANAEKKQIGKFHSTPIFSFRFKHTVCGGWLEIHTNPQNTEYVVASGGRRRDYGPDERVEEGELAFLTPEERERRREDAFAALEGRVDEKKVEKKNKERIEELYEAQHRAWEDPYELNQKLRNRFRVRRKELEHDNQQKRDIQERFGIGFDIADETNGDAIRAKMIDFATQGAADYPSDEVIKKPLFSRNTQQGSIPRPAPHKLKTEMLAEKSRNDLQKELLKNTRVALDPFLNSTANSNSKTSSPMVPRRKRKRDSTLEDKSTVTPEEAERQSYKLKGSSMLVSYDSDSE